MAVGFDAGTTAVASSGGSAASFSSSTVIQVGTQATLLVVTIVLAPTGATAGPTGITITWGGVSMTQQVVETYTGASQPATAAIFTLINPASGNQVLSASWTNACYAYMGAVSFTGTDIVTGVQVADSTTAGSTGTSQNITITSNTNGATVAVYCNISSAPTTNFNLIWSYQTGTPGAAATYQLGGTSNTHTFSDGSSVFQAVAGVHVISSGFHAASNRWHRLGR